VRKLAEIAVAPAALKVETSGADGLTASFAICSNFAALAGVGVSISSALRGGWTGLQVRGSGCGRRVLKQAVLPHAAAASVVPTRFLAVAKDALVATRADAARKIAAGLGFGHSWFGLDDLPAGADAWAVRGGFALCVAGCLLTGGHEGEPCLELDAVDLVAQALRPAPSVRCLRGDDGEVSIEFSSGTFHVNGLQPTEPGGELSHLALVKCSDSIKAEAECLAVFAHLPKQVAGECANSIGGRGVAADEDNEMVMGV
jgi:hypothetical protein